MNKLSSCDHSVAMPRERPSSHKMMREEKGAAFISACVCIAIRCINSGVQICFDKYALMALT